MKLFKFYAKVWKDFWGPGYTFDSIYASQVLVSTFAFIVFFVAVIIILLT